MADFPSSKDILFKAETSADYGAWIKNPANKFFLYSEGYREAGQMLYKFCVDNPFYSNILIYPLVFNYRQFLELRLKELIIMGFKYRDEVKGFPDIHSLRKLWDIYRNELLINIENIDKNLLDNVEMIINQFEKEDPNSMNFRYPVGRAPDRKESVNRETIDIKGFKEVIDKLINFLDFQWEMISHYEDLKAEMIADMYSNYWE